MATHSSILAWKIPWTEEFGGATVHGVAKSQTQLEHARICVCIYIYTHTHTHIGVKNT